MFFEAQLVKHLASKQPDQARARLNNLAEEDKYLLFGNPGLWSQGALPNETFLLLAREHLPKSRFDHAVTMAWSNPADPPGFGKVSKVLEEIPFTDRERLIIARQSILSALSAETSPNQVKQAYHWALETIPTQARNEIVRSSISSSKPEKAFQALLPLNDSELETEFARQLSSKIRNSLEETLQNFTNPDLARQLRELTRSLEIDQ